MLDTPKILEDLYNTLTAAVYRAYDRETLSDHLKSMSIETPSVSSEIIKLGDQYSDFTLDKDNITAKDADRYILHFRWMEEAKNFMILWRDIRLEGAKALHYQQDDLVDHISVKSMLEQSKALLLHGIESMKSVFPQWESELSLEPDKLKNKVLDWNKQINPWPEYKHHEPALC